MSDLASLAAPAAPADGVADARDPGSHSVVGCNVNPVGEAARRRHEQSHVRLGPRAVADVMVRSSFTSCSRRSPAAAATATAPTAGSTAGSTAGTPAATAASTARTRWHREEESHPSWAVSHVPSPTRMTPSATSSSSHWQQRSRGRARRGGRPRGRHADRRGDASTPRRRTRRRRSRSPSSTLFRPSRDEGDGDDFDLAEGRGEAFRGRTREVAGSCAAPPQRSLNGSRGLQPNAFRFGPNTVPPATAAQPFVVLVGGFDRRSTQS